MKVALVLLVLMPFALSASVDVDKRGILDFLGQGDLIDIPQLKATVQSILNKVGSDATEQQCESACHDSLAVDESNLLHTLCTPICRSFQTVIRLFHLTPSS